MLGSLLHMEEALATLCSSWVLEVGRSPNAPNTGRCVPKIKK